MSAGGLDDEVAVPLIELAEVSAGGLDAVVDPPLDAVDDVVSAGGLDDEVVVVPLEVLDVPADGGAGGVSDGKNESGSR